MKIDYVPLLATQRQLHRLPRGMERFHEYLRVMLNAERDDLLLPPLAIMNPMAKEHVTALLDELLLCDADGVAARAAVAAAEELADAPGEFKASLVVADDLLGGWTNRYACEYGLRRADPRAKRFWITGVLWSSEPPSARAARETLLAAVHRTAYMERHGPPRTLRDLLRQEGRVMALAGSMEPRLDPEDLAYTREVLAPYLEAEDMPTAIACLFGDPAARSLGFAPRGLSPGAGLALALDEARAELPLELETLVQDTAG